MAMSEKPSRTKVREDTKPCEDTKPREDIRHFPEIIELNVGGQVYVTHYPTLVSVPGSLFWEMFSENNPSSLTRDRKGRLFIDRDGFLFRYVLDYMRDQNLVLPEQFPEYAQLQREAEYFRLPELMKMLADKINKLHSVGSGLCRSDGEELSTNTDTICNFSSSNNIQVSGPDNSPTLTAGSASDRKKAGFITISYRGYYTLCRDSHTDFTFHHVPRIMVCGKISLAREVFGDTLNESRDPYRPSERYTARYYFTFNFLEQAFDRLADAGFYMVASNSTGTSTSIHVQTVDKNWITYTEYLFCRDI